MEHLSCPFGLAVNNSLSGGSLPIKMFENREPMIITTDFFDHLLDTVTVGSINDGLMKKVQHKIKRNITQKLRKN
jgi:hypothetical protein